MEPTF